MSITIHNNRETHALDHNVAIEERLEEHSCCIKERYVHVGVDDNHQGDGVVHS
jgi:hypothetical protein